MLEHQTSIFDIMYPKIKIKNDIRLIELFSGYGSQALALKYINVSFEHWKTCEWAIKSIQAYKDIHFTNDNTNYSDKLNKDEIINYLYEKGISSNYNEPMTLEQVKRLNENQLRLIYNNIKITNNLVNIQQVRGKDLEIKDIEKYTYIMTYSFPCQDLSLAGKGKGMADTSTRSGMLWEVERILDECNELGNIPQILLMENVPQVHGTDNVEYFNKWQLKLEQLGYKNYFQDLIATDYGIPQTRNRCFMVSILGDYSYAFPQPMPLKLKLKDMLEDKVDEKYYITPKQIEDIKKWNSYEKPLEHIEDEIVGTLTTRSGAYCAGMKLTKDTTNYIEWKEKGKLDMDCRAFKEDKVMGSIMTSNEKNKVLLKDNLKKELCNKLIEENKVEEYDVIRHSYSNARLSEWENRGTEKNNLSPTLDTRCDCLGIVIPEATKQGYAIANDGDGVYINRPYQKRGVVQKEKIQTLKTSCNDVGVVINPLKGITNKSWQFEQQVYDENGCARTLKASEGSGNIPKIINNNLRIRKLTPKECFRLMGVKDEDYDNCARNQSNASLYHLAGDSIVVNILCEIFKQML